MQSAENSLLLSWSLLVQFPGFTLQLLSQPHFLSAFTPHPECNCLVWCVFYCSLVRFLCVSVSELKAVQVICLQRLLGAWLLCFNRRPPWFGLFICVFLWCFLLVCYLPVWSFLFVFLSDHFSVRLQFCILKKAERVLTFCQWKGWLFLPSSIGKQGKTGITTLLCFTTVWMVSSLVPYLNPAQQMCHLWQNFF